MNNYLRFIGWLPCILRDRHFLGEKIPVSIPEEGIKSKGLHDTLMNVSAGVEETCSIT
jgi:hypothetical protein